MTHTSNGVANSMRLLAGFFLAALFANAAGAQQLVMQTPATVVGAQQPANQMPAPVASPQQGGIQTLATVAHPTAPTSIAREVTPGARPLDPEAEAAPAKPGHEGVTVHGHWIIDVKNPDGTLAQHHEFENSLAGYGGGVLVGLLSGQVTPGNFAVTLYSTGTNPCGPYCYLVPSFATQPGLSFCAGAPTQCASTLTVIPGYGVNFNGPFSLTLAGSITATQAGTINSVDSGLTTCPGTGNASNPTGPATVLPSACAASTSTTGQYPYLTGTGLGTPISVANGQLIQVQVIISFS